MLLGLQRSLCWALTTTRPQVLTGDGRRGAPVRCPAGGVQVDAAAERGRGAGAWRRGGGRCRGPRRLRVGRREVGPAQGARPVRCGYPCAPQAKDAVVGGAAQVPKATTTPAELT